MDILVRYATKNDAALIADVSRQTFYETFAAQNSQKDMDKFLAEQFTRSALMEEVGAPNNLFLLAYYNNAVAGYARLREGTLPDGAGELPALEIARIYAVKAMVGKGVGKALMQQSIAIATAKAKGVIWLGVWEKNERAIQFYQRWGFQKFAVHDFILGDDVQVDWLMKKYL